MKKLFVFTLYAEKGPSSQYRTFIFRKEIENNFDVRWFYFWNNEYVTRYIHNKRKYALHILFQYLFAVIRRWFQLTFIASRCDVVFIQKACIPKIKNTFLKRIKNKGVRLIFDVDDAIYALPGDNSSIIAKLSDCVICGNQTLKDYYNQFNDNCIILPTVENTFKYSPYWSDTYDNKIIGWIGSKTTIDNLDLVVKALNEFTTNHPEVKIAIISNTALEYTDKIKNSYLVKWAPETYIQELSKFSIGIMPLKDNEINRGKCGFKLIQYLNMKKPVVGSGVGVNADIIKGNGIIADSTEDWISAFEKILYDRDYYENCINHIESDFFDTYHFSKVSNRLLEILNG